MMKRLTLLMVLIMSSFTMFGCKEKELVYSYGDDEIMVKVWEDKVIYNETVVLEDNGMEISGQLIFAPTQILSVRDYTLNKTYDPSEYEVIENRIVRTETSTIPYLTTEQLAGQNLPEEYALSTYQAKAPGTQIVFTEGIGIVMHQIAVSYVHEGTWTGPTPAYQGQYLQNVLAKLEANEDIRVVFNGDSISTGANASGVLGISPYLDGFPTLFTNGLQNEFGVTVELINTSVGGTLSNWGKQNVDPNVNTYEPDLVVIGFGMNDGSLGVNVATFKDNIEFMIQSIRARNSEADIIIISTILANPVSIQNAIQKDYLPGLLDLQEQYQVALLDMSSLSEELYKTKKGVDILSNNINHPSDFLVRCYAAGLMALMVN